MELHETFHFRVSHRRDIRNSVDFLDHTKRSNVDLRHLKLFHSDPELECCPTLTEYAGRTTAINVQGLVLELYTVNNITQTFYETLCHPAIKNRPCQFIDPRIAYASRCTQQYSYVQAIGRTFGHIHEQYRMEHIRVASGCKCQVKKAYMRKRNDDASGIHVDDVGTDLL